MFKFLTPAILLFTTGMASSALAAEADFLKCISVEGTEREFDGYKYNLPAGLESKITYDDGWFSDSIGLGGRENYSYDPNDLEERLVSGERVREELAAVGATIPSLQDSTQFASFYREERSLRTIYYADKLFIDKKLLDGSASVGQVFVIRRGYSQWVGLNVHKAAQCERIAVE